MTAETKRLSPRNDLMTQLAANYGREKAQAQCDTADDAMTGNFLTDFHIGSSWFDDALTVSPRPNAWTGQ